MQVNGNAVEHENKFANIATYRTVKIILLFQTADKGKNRIIFKLSIVGVSNLKKLDIHKEYPL